MESAYLLDSNAIIDFLEGKLPEEGKTLLNTIVDADCRVSIISKIEVLGFDGDQVELQTISDFINEIKLLYLTSEVVNQTIELRKNHKVKLPDAIIAATAIVNNCTLVTRNIKDFHFIPNLQLLNPHQPGS